MPTIDEQGPSKLAVAAPLLLAAAGPVGAGVGLLGSLFQAGRRRGARREFAQDVRATEFDPTTAASGDILGELVEREAAGLERSPVLEAAFAQAGAREQRARDALIASAAAQRQQQQDAQAVNNEMFDRTNVLRDDMTPIMAPVATGGRQLQAMVNAPEGFAGDTVIINNFARMLNPGERLTQDDIEAVSGDPRLAVELQRAIRKHFETGEALSAGERAQLVEAGAGLLKFTQDAAKVQIQPILATANAYGIDPQLLISPQAFIPNEVLVGLQGAGRPPPTPTPAPVTTPTPNSGAPTRLTFDQLMQMQP